ncbi:DUF1294 domain-containing protein [Halomonas sp. I5-271120]|uniref:DUF1294 domain-containing protein n=1 Tax=Halomonas sp. I5-271120 TaxID=3061632 RepID=UPI0027154DD4|nr:DUF1294 domain-containing protein [Halomonas sp. I5-271120]
MAVHIEAMDILAWYLGASLVGFLAYAWDKRAAVRGHWRIAEAKLHLFDLAGAWPGSLLARKWLRHKTRKQPFIAVFWVMAIANLGLLVWLFRAVA